jgi:hypothetical protein
MPCPFHARDLGRAWKPRWVHRHTDQDAKLKRMSGEHFVGMVEQQVAMYRAAGDTAGEAAFLER